MREKYESLALADLKGIAKARGMKGVSTMKKAQLVEAMLMQDEKDKAAKQAPAQAKQPSRVEELRGETDRRARLCREKAGGAHCYGEADRGARLCGKKTGGAPLYR